MKKKKKKNFLNNCPLDKKKSLNGTGCDPVSIPTYFFGLQLKRAKALLILILLKYYRPSYICNYLLQYDFCMPAVPTEIIF